MRRLRRCLLMIGVMIGMFLPAALSFAWLHEPDGHCVDHDGDCDHIPSPVIPEPSTMALLGLGGLGAGIIGRRGRRRLGK